MFLIYVKRFYFPVFLVLASVVYGFQYYSYPLPNLINNYLNDLLCMPVVLKICQYTVCLIRNDRNLKIPFEIAFSLTVLYAIYFELLLPKINPRYTADWIDVVLYFTGLLFFLWIENIKSDKITNSDFGCKSNHNDLGRNKGE